MLWLLGMIILVTSSWWQWRRREFVDRPGWYFWWALPLAGLALVVIFWPPWIHLQKTIGYLVMPTGLIWLALIACYCCFRFERRFAWVLIALFVVYTAAGNRWLGTGMLHLVEGDYRDIDPLAENSFDAIFVLGADTGTDHRGRARIGGSGDRILLAIELYRKGYTDTLVCSGHSIEGIDEGHDLAAETKQIWATTGIPDDHILCLHTPRNTREELAAYKALAADKGWTSIGLISSAWHLPRAMAKAKSIGLVVTPLPADLTGPVPGPALPNLIPQSNGFRAVQAACWEVIGRLVGF